MSILEKILFSSLSSFISIIKRENMRIERERKKIKVKIDYL